MHRQMALGQIDNGFLIGEIQPEINIMCFWSHEPVCKIQPKGVVLRRVGLIRVASQHQHLPVKLEPGDHQRNLPKLAARVQGQQFELQNVLCVVVVELRCGDLVFEVLVKEFHLIMQQPRRLEIGFSIRHAEREIC